MAEKIPFTPKEPMRLLFASITEASAPPGTNAEKKFSGQFGVMKVDFDALVPLMVQAIQAETGTFSGNPGDYYLACMSGRMASERAKAKGELDAQAAIAKGEGQDAAFKIRERVAKRCAVYEQFAGILTASSKFDIELARLDGGKIVDIVEPHARATAGKELFVNGSFVVPKIALQGFRRKKLDDKDGVTSFLQNVLFIKRGPKLDLGGGQASNQEVFGGFANYSDFDPTAMAPGGGSGFEDYKPQGGTVVPPSEQAAPPPPPAADLPPPPPPLVDPNRPVDPRFIHNNGDGTEQWAVNGAWDGGKHPVPGTGGAANFPPPPADGPTTSTTISPSNAQW